MKPNETSLRTGNKTVKKVIFLGNKLVNFLICLEGSKGKHRKAGKATGGTTEL